MDGKKPVAIVGRRQNGRSRRRNTKGSKKILIWLLAPMNHVDQHVPVQIEAPQQYFSRHLLLIRTTMISVVCVYLSMVGVRIGTFCMAQSQCAYCTYVRTHNTVQDRKVSLNEHVYE